MAMGRIFFMCAKIALALTSWAYGLIMFYVLPFYTQKLPFQFWYLNFDLPRLKHNILIWHSVNSVINVFKNCKHNSGDATDLTIRPKWKTKSEWSDLPATREGNYLTLVAFPLKCFLSNQNANVTSWSQIGTNARWLHF